MLPWTREVTGHPVSSYPDLPGGRLPEVVGRAAAGRVGVPDPVKALMFWRNGEPSARLPRGLRMKVTRCSMFPALEFVRPEALEPEADAPEDMVRVQSHLGLRLDPCDVEAELGPKSALALEMNTPARLRCRAGAARAGSLCRSIASADTGMTVMS